MGGGMAVFGAFYALLQNDMRRLLSYHIQSQVGYMVAGVGIGSALASSGAFAHVFNHILYKSLLFMTVGVVIYRTGEESLKKVGGLGREMPLTATAFAIAALSIAGFPGFNGFVSKGMVIGAAHEEHLDALWYLLLLGGVGTFLSFIKLGYYAFLHGEYAGRVSDATPGQSVAMSVVAGLCVLYGLVPGLLFGILPLRGEFDYTVFTLGHVGEGVALAVAGVVGFALLKRPLSKVGRVPDVDSAYNPLTFRGTRAVVYAVTDLYAAVDRIAVRLAGTAVAAGRDPRAAADRVGWPWTLRSGIGRSVLLVTIVAAVALVALLFA
jgi:multicomponent Na+:H+ antiporter subunit D